MALNFFYAFSFLGVSLGPVKSDRWATHFNTTTKDTVTFFDFLSLGYMIKFIEAAKLQELPHSKSAIGVQKSWATPQFFIFVSKETKSGLEQ